MNECADEMWRTIAMKRSSFLKRKEIQTHAAACMNLEDVTLSKISRSQKKNTLIPFIEDT